VSFGRKANYPSAAEGEAPSVSTVQKKEKRLTKRRGRGSVQRSLEEGKQDYGELFRKEVATSEGETALPLRSRNGRYALEFVQIDLSARIHPEKKKSSVFGVKKRKAWQSMPETTQSDTGSTSSRPPTARGGLVFCSSQREKKKRE